MQCYYWKMLTVQYRLIVLCQSSLQYILKQKKDFCIFLHNCKVKVTQFQVILTGDEYIQHVSVYCNLITYWLFIGMTELLL